MGIYLGRDRAIDLARYIWKRTPLSRQLSPILRHAQVVNILSESSLIVIQVTVLQPVWGGIAKDSSLFFLMELDLVGLDCKANGKKQGVPFPPILTFHTRRGYVSTFFPSAGYWWLPFSSTRGPHKTSGTMSSVGTTAVQSNTSHCPGLQWHQNSNSCI